MELITRQVIRDIEGTDEGDFLKEYADPDSPRYQGMTREIGRRLGFTSLSFNRLDDMIEALGLPRDKVCTYCWDGRE